MFCELLISCVIESSYRTLFIVYFIKTASSNEFHESEEFCCRILMSIVIVMVVSLVTNVTAWAAFLYRFGYVLQHIMYMILIYQMRPFGKKLPGIKKNCYTCLVG